MEEALNVEKQIVKIIEKQVLWQERNKTISSSKNIQLVKHLMRKKKKKILI